MRGRAVWLGLAAVVLAAALPAQIKQDPFVGTWAMDPDKSTFTPGPVPTERYMTLEISEKGMMHLTKTPSLFGGSSNIVYTAKFDGKDYEILGTGLDTVSLKPVDSNTIERSRKESGKVSETTALKISGERKICDRDHQRQFSGRGI